MEGNFRADKTIKKAVTTMVHLFNAIDDKIDKITKELENKIEGISERLEQTETVTSALITRRGVHCKTNSKSEASRRGKSITLDSESSSSVGSCFKPISKSKDSHVTESSVHQEVLVDNHELLMSSIDLTNSTVLDDLMMNDVISQSDAEYVRSQTKVKDKTRQLLLTLARYGPACFTKFVQCLKLEYPFLFDKLNEDFNNMLSRAHECKICVVCKIKCTVDKHDIVDTLYSNKLLRAQTVESVLKCRNVKQSWNQIIYHVNKEEDGIDILCKALDLKYKHLSNQLQESGLQKLCCICADSKDNTMNEDFLSHNSLRSSYRTEMGSTTTMVSSADSLTFIKRIYGSSSNDDVLINDSYEQTVVNERNIEITGGNTNLKENTRKDSTRPSSAEDEFLTYFQELLEQHFDLNRSRHLSMTRKKYNNNDYEYRNSKSLPTSIDITCFKEKTTGCFQKMGVKATAHNPCQEVDTSNDQINELKLLPRTHVFRKAFRSSCKIPKI